MLGEVVNPSRARVLRKVPCEQVDSDFSVQISGGGGGQAMLQHVKLFAGVQKCHVMREHKTSAPARLYMSIAKVRLAGGGYLPPPRYFVWRKSESACSHGTFLNTRVCM